jgi:hypothetical protein
VSLGTPARGAPQHYLGHFESPLFSMSVRGAPGHHLEYPGPPLAGTSGHLPRCFGQNGPITQVGPVRAGWIEFKRAAASGLASDRLGGRGHPAGTVRSQTGFSWPDEKLGTMGRRLLEWPPRGQCSYRSAADHWRDWVAVTDVEVGTARAEMPGFFIPSRIAPRTRRCHRHVLWKAARLVVRPKCLGG